MGKQFAFLESALDQLGRFTLSWTPADKAKIAPQEVPFGLGGIDRARQVVQTFPNQRSRKSCLFVLDSVLFAMSNLCLNA